MQLTYSKANKTVSDWNV